MNFLLAAFTLWQREMVRFFRQKNRIIGALATPMVFWVLIGSGMGNSFRPPGDETISALSYMYPGIMVMIILFTAIFATISVIEDRREGFLQSVLASPAPRESIVFGKVLGGSSIALVQALVFLVFAPWAGYTITFSSLIPLLLVLFLLGFGLTGLGFVMAWQMDSTQGFHAIMNLFLMPMWLLSGSFFPVSGAPAWLQFVMLANPLTYGLRALRRVLESGSVGFFNSTMDLGFTFLFSVLIFILGLWVVRKRTVIS